MSDIANLRQFIAWGLEEFSKEGNRGLGGDWWSYWGDGMQRLERVSSSAIEGSALAMKHGLSPDPFINLVKPTPTRSNIRELFRSADREMLKLDIIISTSSPVTSNESLKRPPRHEWLARAMLLRKENPGWTDRQVAAEVGVNPPDLSRSLEYRTYRDSLRDGSSIRRGTTWDGEVDAIYHDPEPDSDD